MQPTIAIDWDGTLVTNTWPAQSKVWQPGAIEALRKLTTFARVVVHTSRVAPMHWPDEVTPKDPGAVQAEINYIRQMLDDAGFPDVEIWTKPWKLGANAYVDDKGVHYTGHPKAWDHLVDKLAAMCGREDLIA